MSTPTLDGKERWQSALLAEFSSAREVAKTQIPEGSTCVLLGECTHGTEEFYELRAEITKYLIEVRGFKIVLCEADWTFMWHVNQYIHRKRAKPFPDNIRFPKWMWQNRPFFELVEWMRKRASSDGPYLFGMDCYCKDESKEEVMKFLDLHARNTLGKEFRGTCFPTEKPDRWPGILAKLQWEIQNDLAGVPAEDDANDSGSTASKRRRRSGAGALQQGACGNVILSSKSFRGCTNLDQFNAEQNLECMIAADEYYSKQRLEPPGSRASWNARDQHMMTTVIRLRENSLHLFNQEKEDLKIVIWAHNSHVGDATATPMGGANFERNEKWNLGQMCRNMLDSVFIVGFYSNCGQVRAAHKWGGEGVTMKLRDAMENSFEARMRRWFGPGGKGYINFSRLRKQQASSSTSTPALKEPTQVAQIYNPSQAGSFAPLNVEYRAVHTSVQLTRTRELPKEGDAAPAPSGETRNEFPVDINASFIAVERAQVHTKYRQVITRLQIKSYQGRSELDGYWVTEHVSGSCGSTSIHCLPAAWLDTCNSNAVKSQETMQSVELLTRIVNFPMQQRWVGVQYHPETELKSHYGEMVVSRCYDLVMYVDKTNAIGMDMTNEAHSLSTAEQDLLATPAQEDQGIKTGGSVTSTAAAPKQTNRRLMMELRRITKEPVDFIQARPLDNNILEWHFVLEGTQEPYTKGKYHGILEFPDEFPMKPPSIKMLTPSGRFEINKRICLSMSDFHKESWNPSWTVEKILIGLMSFMYEESTESIGSILESWSNRKRYAQESHYFNAQNEIYVELFMTPDEQEFAEQIRWLRNAGGADADDGASGVACRYCLVDSGDLIVPCECKGSSAYVHLQCLRQWQRSVLLTQPTHPRYQTNIDEICNVCEKPFKTEYQPPKRHSVLLEYTGAELPALIQKGNLLVSSCVKSEKNHELMEKHPDMRERLAHFTDSVYFIAMCETYDSRKRGGGAVLAVNLVAETPDNKPLPSARRFMPGDRFELVLSPQQVWESEYAHVVHRVEKKLFGSASDGKRLKLQHYIGGPVEPADAFGLVEVMPEVLEWAYPVNMEATPAIKEVRLMAKRLRIKANLYFGNLSSILGFMEKMSMSAIKGGVELKVFWGYASWNATQLLGEIARRSWGLVTSDPDLNFARFDEGWSKWENLLDQSIVCNESEYSGYG